MATTQPRPAATTDTSVDAEYPSSRMAWYVVGVLTFVYMFSFIDRQILNLLVRPIKRDLEISDTQMSLLMGFSFALFYTFFGIPLGRMADTRSRRSLIAGGFALWSLFTTACGLAKNYFQLLFFRMGVGVGEAALSPAAYSMISDYFPPARRATAISVYAMGIYIGSGLAMIVGGTVAGLAATSESWELPLVGATRPWQLVFFIVGLPGILLALIMYTVPEPKRRGSKRAGETVPIAEAAAYLKRNWTTLFCHNVGFAALSFGSYAAGAWVPTLFVRKHGWSEAQAGQVYGLCITIFCTAGVVFGGWITDRWLHRGYHDASLRVGAWSALLGLPLAIAYPLVNDGWLAVAILIPSCFLAAVPFGTAPAAIQQVMPNAMRGLASAIYLFVVNLIGLGLGPTAVAVVTDFVFHDESKVYMSMVVVAILAHVVALACLTGGQRPFRNSLERLRAWQQAEHAQAT